MNGDDELQAALERTIHAGVVSQWHGTMREDVALTDPPDRVRELLAEYREDGVSMMALGVLAAALDGTAE